MRTFGAGQRPAVFLDRDGVLNRAFVRDGRAYPPTSVEELEILPGVPDACAELRSRGYLLVVVTNQPDVARGALRSETLDAIHARLHERLPLDSIWICPHDDADGCRCRKPAPGLLLRAAEHHHIDLRRSFMVGDRWRDIEAGHSARCRTVFVDHGYEDTRPTGADAEVKNLPEAAAWIFQAQSQLIDKRFQVD